MRILPPALALALALAGALRATDFPTVKTVLPDLPTTPGVLVTPIDLRNHFEITAVTAQVVQFQTTLGNYNLALRPDAAPASVTNFLNYVNGGRYVNTIVHRSDKSLGVIQGGGYGLPSLGRIPTNAPIALEYNLPNLRGTIAMARTTQVNSATSEWFINTDDNTVDLGQSNGGGYAVFGKVLGTGMTVVDAIHALEAYPFQSPFGQLPLRNYTSGTEVGDANFIKVTAAQVVPVFPETGGQLAVVTFSVTGNTTTAVATAQVNGSTLTIFPGTQTSGFTDITVRATDTNGNFVEDTFRYNAVREVAVTDQAGGDVADGGSRAYQTTLVGSSRDLTFTVRSVGTSNLTITGNPRATLTGTHANDFNVVTQPAGTIAPGGTSSFLVRFTPQSSGTKTATLHFSSDDGDESPYDIDLSGKGNVRPTLTLPIGTVVKEAAGPNGAVVDFVVTANDEEDGTLNPGVNPPSGSVFPVGETDVAVTVSDSDGGNRQGTFKVRVEDTTPPQIGGTFAPLVLWSDRAGKPALPNYVTQAVKSDLVGVTAVTQEPAAGTLLEDGITNVTLTARDVANNTATTSFAVTVSPTTAKVIAKEDPVPGAGTDPHKWTTFGVPSVTLNGAVPEVGWLSTVTVSPLSSFSGIFSGPVGAPALRLKTNVANGVTDAAGAPVVGLKFASFRAPVFAGADFAVIATVKGTKVVPLVNDTGLWVNAGGTLRGIARAGTAAPGAGTTKFLSLSSVAMPAPGTVFFTAKLNTPIIEKDFGLWRWNSTDGTQLVLREGATIDLGAGPVKVKAFTALSSVGGSPGHGRYDPSVPAIDVMLTVAAGTVTSTAIGTITPDGVLHVTARATTTDSANRVLKGVGIPSSPGEGLAATALATFVPNPALNLTATNNRTVFDFETETILAQLATPAPGTAPATGATPKFFSFQNPAAGFGLGGLRTTVFGATLSGTTTARDQGVWTHHPMTGLTLLAREGSVPPDAPGTKWLSFSSVSVLDGRGPMFVGKLVQAPPKVTVANDTGFWATDSTGALRLFLRTSDKIGTKKVTAFALLGAVSGSPGQRRAWVADDTSPRVFYRVSFNDGSTAIMSTVIP